MKNFFYLPCIVILLCACSATNHVYISVVEPSPVSLPPYAKNAVVVNRSEVDPNVKAVDVVDKIFSLEGVALDKDGAQASIDALTMTLQKDSRFVSVQSIGTAGLYTTVPGIFPTPLGWQEVERICRENDADILFTLELFDTDSKVNYNAAPVNLNTPLGNVPAIEHTARMNTMVKTGWRIYDPGGKAILDEFPISRNLNFVGRGINPVAAAAALLSRKDAVKETGSKAGEAYGIRILPFYARVTRDYYVRGTDNFQIARRKAQTGNWQGAAELWQQETAASRSKIAGRACYNMAIISEINGNLDDAIGWAQKAYENYGNKLALRYVRVLEGRRVRTVILNDQVTP